MASSRELLSLDNSPMYTEDRPTTLMEDKKTRRRRLYLKIALLTLFLMVILLTVIIYLATRRSAATATAPAHARRPFLRHMRRGECPSAATGCPAGPPPLLLVSIDGFRPEYLQRGVSPMLQDMIECGVTAPYMRVAFPSKTFPNHYSIVTGLYPESSGIVGNTMYDPALPGRRFRLGKAESFYPVWWKGEPVWKSVEKMGGKSAVYFWPGSEVAGLQPSLFRAYDSKVPFSDRVTQVVKWLRLPAAERPRFLSLYFHQPDRSGHKYGPDSEQVTIAVEQVDSQLASLYNQLVDYGMLGCVDVVVVSDHGMAAIKENCPSVILDDIVPGLSNSSLFVNGPVTRIRPNNESEVNDLVTQLDCAHPGLRVWRRTELPERWHYQHSSRIEPIVASVDQGLGLSVNAKKRRCSHGTHGWDNDLPDMHSIFLAHGPSFKRNYKSPPFESVQLRSLFQTLLDLPDLDTNATKHSLDHLLVSPKSDLTRIGEGSGKAHVLEMEKTLTKRCCLGATNCQCAETKTSFVKVKNDLSGIAFNISDVFPLPVTSGKDTLYSAFDGTFVGAVSGSSTGRKSANNSSSAPFRWLQYTLLRYSNTSGPLHDNQTDSQFSALRLPERQCLYLPAELVTPLHGCPERPPDADDVTRTSLVLTPGADTHLTRLAGTMYPTYRAYRDHVVPEMRRRLADLWRSAAAMVVLSGPVYRSETKDSGRAMMPSHFYYQVRACPLSAADCLLEGVVHKQWILPHQRHFRRCEVADKWVDFHEATLRDLERVSGLLLFSGQVVSQPESPYTSHARYITQLPEFKVPQTWGETANRTSAGKER